MTISGSALIDFAVAILSLCATAVGVVVWWLVTRSVKAIDRRQDECDTKAKALDSRERRHYEELLREQGNLKSRLAALEAIRRD